MNKEEWKPGQNPNDKKAAGINERHFLGHELSGIMAHMAGCTGRAIVKEELPYLAFFYRWGEDLAKLFNENDRLAAFIKAKEDEVKELRQLNESLRHDADALRSKNKPLQNEINKQAERIVGLLSENEKMNEALANLNENHNQSLADANELVDILVDIATYKGRSINTVKEKAKKGYLNHGKGKEEISEQSGQKTGKQKTK